MESLKNNITVSFKWKIHHVQRHRDSRKILIQLGLSHTSMEMHAGEFRCRMREDFLHMPKYC